MGIRDRLFRGRKNNPDPNQDNLDKKFNELKNKLEASMPDQPVDVDYRINIAQNLAKHNQSPTGQTIADIAQEEAKKIQIEMKMKEFSETHMAVENFRKDFLAQQIRKKIGIDTSEMQSSYMTNLEALQTSGLISDRYIGKIFLPYLIEKKALGIISNDEQQELNSILGTTGKLEDLENATTQESYTLDFNKALIILGSIGVIKLEEFASCKEFPNGRALRDSNSMGNLEMYVESTNLANKIYSAISHLPDSKKHITPTEILSSALKQTPIDKVNEAKSIELSELTQEKGDKEID